MSRGLGKVQREILDIIEKQDLDDGVWLSIDSILIQMDAVKPYPHSKAQSIWRALRRLEKLGYIKTRKFLPSAFPEDRRAESDFRFKYVRLGDKRLVVGAVGEY